MNASPRDEGGDAPWSILNAAEEAALKAVREAIERVYSAEPAPGLEQISPLLEEAGAEWLGPDPRFRLGEAVFRLRVDPEEAGALEILFEEEAP